MEVIAQPDWQYAVITVRDPFREAFSVIPGAYKTLTRYMEVNNLMHREDREVLPCFEKVYEKDRIPYMDLYISTEG